MPIVKISKVIKEMSIGEQLQITATDPAFRADIEAWIRRTGQKLISFTDGAVKSALIEKVKV